MSGSHLSNTYHTANFGDQNVGFQVGHGGSGNVYNYNAQDREYQIRKELLASLWYPSIHSREVSLKPHHEGTFEWLLDPDCSRPGTWRRTCADAYRTWLREDDDTFWMIGKVGSGKSTLMHFMANDHRTREALSTWAGSRGVVILSFYFFLAGSPEERSVHGLFRSILHQLISALPNQVGMLLQHLNVLEISAYAWTEKRLFDVLKFLLDSTATSTSVCLFLDGLDEFGHDPGDLSSYLGKLCTLPNFKLCVSSRPLQVRRFEFGSPRVILQDVNRDDIARLVKDRLGRHKRIQELKCHDEHAVMDLLDAITHTAEGVFLWAVFAIGYLLEGLDSGDDIATLHTRLSDLPPNDLDQLYSFMIDKLLKPYRKQVAEVVMLAIDLSDLCVLDLVIRHDQQFSDDFLACRTSKAIDDFIRKRLVLYQRQVVDVHRQIDTRCANILEVVQHEAKWPDSLRGRSLRIRFVHRSARDFFADVSNLRRLLVDEVDLAANRDILLTSLRVTSLVYPVVVVVALRQILATQVVDVEKFMSLSDTDVLDESSLAGQPQWLARKEIYDDLHYWLDARPVENSGTVLEVDCDLHRLLDHEHKTHGIIADDTIAHMQDVKSSLAQSGIYLGKLGARDAVSFVLWYPLYHVYREDNMTLFRLYMPSISQHSQCILLACLWRRYRGSDEFLQCVLGLPAATRDRLLFWLLPGTTIYPRNGQWERLNVIIDSVTSLETLLRRVVDREIVQRLLMNVRLPPSEVWTGWKLFLAARLLVIHEVYMDSIVDVWPQWEDCLKCAHVDPNLPIRVMVQAKWLHERLAIDFTTTPHRLAAQCGTYGKLHTESPNCSNVHALHYTDGPDWSVSQAWYYPEAETCLRRCIADGSGSATPTCILCTFLCMSPTSRATPRTAKMWFDFLRDFADDGDPDETFKAFLQPLPRWSYTLLSIDFGYTDNENSVHRKGL